MNVLSNFKKIRAFVLDVDGVLTDGSLLLFDDGQMARRMNIKDGYALQLAIRQGYFIMVISGGTSGAVEMRLQKLGITEIVMAVADKKALLTEFVQRHELTWDAVLYMGDDIPDIEPMRLAGLPCCPADAGPETRAVSHYISTHKGGYGCVRDVIEKVLKLNGHWSFDERVTSK